MNPGRADQRVTFRKRGEIGGVHSGPLVDYLECWARWQASAGQPLAEVGTVTDAVAGTLTVRDTPAGRGIALRDRAVFRGSDLEVVSAPIPDRSGWLAIQVTRRAGGT